MNDATSRVLRTLVQLLAAGAFTDLFLQLASDVPDGYAPYILIGSTLLVSIAQNGVEQATGTKLFRPTT
jgi:hypothetical protein